MAPEATVARASRHLAAMGITRVADVTGLDHVGVPVVMVCRPNARSLSVSQGKGLTLAAAKASGVMESLELHHAEHADLPLRRASHREMAARHRVVDPERLPAAPNSPFHPDLQILWAQGHDVLDDEPVWVPHELVHLNCTLPLPAGSGCFPLTSNGLASGNHVLEALSHGMCELIERDATVLWHRSGSDAQRRTRVDLATIDDPASAEVVQRCHAAGLDVAVWETTTDVGVPAFLCMVTERADSPWRLLYAATGMGCHPTRDVAVLRALTEALQSRLTMIAGSRDDCFPWDYDRSRDPGVLQRQRAAMSNAPARSFRDAPSWHEDTVAGDVAGLLARLESAGVTRVVAVELTAPPVDVPVVRVIADHLEGPDDVDCPPGPRARRVMATAEAAG